VGIYIKFLACNTMMDSCKANVVATMSVMFLVSVMLRVIPPKIVSPQLVILLWKVP
jgi:hypothetical protein